MVIKACASCVESSNSVSKVQMVSKIISERYKVVEASDRLPEDVDGTLAPRPRIKVAMEEGEMRRCCPSRCVSSRMSV